MMNIFRAFLILGLASILFNSCKERPKNIIKKVPIVFTKEGELSIYKQKEDTLITTFDIEFAENAYETETGLMYRKNMKDNQGMFFIFPDEQLHSFYMKNTEFSLDIIYIDSNLKIASFQKNTEPYNEMGLSSQVPVQYVLEIKAGLADKWLLKVGDKIRYTKN